MMPATITTVEKSLASRLADLIFKAVENFDSRDEDELMAVQQDGLKIDRPDYIPPMELSDLEELQEQIVEEIKGEEAGQYTIEYLEIGKELVIGVERISYEEY